MIARARGMSKACATWPSCTRRFRPRLPAKEVAAEAATRCDLSLQRGSAQLAGRAQLRSLAAQPHDLEVIANPPLGHLPRVPFARSLAVGRRVRLEVGVVEFGMVRHQ